MESFIDKKIILDKTIKLVRLDLELTHRCNNRCIHCSVNLDKDDTTAMMQEKSFGFYERILTEAKVIGCKKITITGGEPLLCPDFKKIYIFASKLNFSITVFTNATLIDEEYIKLFLDYPPAMIEITVYGMTRETCEKVTRSKHSWEASFRGIKLLHQNNIPIRLKGVHFPFNKADTDKLIKWAENELVLPDQVSFTHGLTLRSVKSENFDSSKIKNLRLNPEKYFGEMTESPDLMQSEFLRLMDLLKKGGDRIFKCGAGKSQAAIDPYGKLAPCLIIRKRDVIFDLNDGSLEYGLTKFFPMIRELRASNEKYLQTCANCIIRPICLQCPANAWIESGHLDEPVEFFCRLAHAQARFAGFLKHDEFGWNTELHAEIINRFKEHMKSDGE